MNVNSFTMYIWIMKMNGNVWNESLEPKLIEIYIAPTPDIRKIHIAQIHELSLWWSIKYNTNTNTLKSVQIGETFCKTINDLLMSSLIYRTKMFKGRFRRIIIWIKLNISYILKM